MHKHKEVATTKCIGIERNKKYRPKLVLENAPIITSFIL
jgi:hypothetical protein